MPSAKRESYRIEIDKEGLMCVECAKNKETIQILAVCGSVGENRRQCVGVMVIEVVDGDGLDVGGGVSPVGELRCGPNSLQNSVCGDVMHGGD
jgi:hypothetical protein